MGMSKSARPAALITGAAKRVGAQIARTLHAAGYDLALHYRHSAKAMHALCDELEAQRKGSTLAIAADLADDLALPDVVGAAADRYGRLDVLVNNASAFYPTPVGETTAAQWDELFAGNARAPFFLSQLAAPHLRQTHGSIVNLADIYAERPLRGHSVYCMAKAALLMLTQSLALELAPAVRVNAVAPGAVLWPDDKPPAEQKQLLARTPLARAGTPQDVADAVLWLARDARYTTGQIIRVDGGRALNI
jgi:pteridine reductase